MKDKIKLVIVLLIGIVISAVISVYAATVIAASEVSYTSNSNTTVETGLNNLYTKANTMAKKVGSATLNTTSKDLSGAVNELYAVRPIVKEYSCTLSNGACASLTTPNGVDFNNYNLPIIQPLYLSSSPQIAWSHSIQQPSNTAFHVYCRVGSSLCTGSIKFNAYFIKK